MFKLSDDEFSEFLRKNRFETMVLGIVCVSLQKRKSITHTHSIIRIEAVDGRYDYKFVAHTERFESSEITREAVTALINEKVMNSPYWQTINAIKKS